MEEAANEVEVYSECMLETKKVFKIIRMTINDIELEDKDNPAVLTILDKWNKYQKLYKQLSINFSKAQTFRRNRIKAEEEREKLRLEEVKNAQEVIIKKLELESVNTSLQSGSSTPGTSTPISRASPSHDTGQLPIRDNSQFKPKITLSSEITFLEMMDWKTETLAWFKARNYTTIDLALQRQLLRQVVEDESWVRGKFVFEDSHIVMINKLCAEFEESLPLFNRRQQFFDTKRGKNESVYTFMVKLQLSAMAAKLDTLTLDEILMHKCMTDMGVTFCKKVVQLKKDPTFKDLLLMAKFDKKEKIVSGEQGHANATLTAGGGSGGCAKNKKK